MRTTENLKKFSYAGRTKGEKDDYLQQVGGTTKDSTGSQDNFDETLPKREPSGKPDEISTPNQPYSSWKTWLGENGRNILVVVIALPILGWLGITFIEYGKNISTLTANYDNLKNDVNSMKDKYDGINEKSIKTSVLLETIQKDIDYLRQKFNK